MKAEQPRDDIESRKQYFNDNLQNALKIRNSPRAIIDGTECELGVRQREKNFETQRRLGRRALIEIVIHRFDEQVRVATIFAENPQHYELKGILPPKKPLKLSDYESLPLPK